MKLYELLSNFSYELYKNRDDVIKFIQSVENEEFFRRILFNRLYYALFHKYLDIDIELKNSSVKKHEAIKAKLKFSNNKFYQVFVKLQNLRIWADYRYEQDKKVIETDLLRLINDVYAIVKRKKI